MYELREYCETLAQELSKALNLPLLLAKVLVARGIKTQEEARQFLSPYLREMTDPLKIPHMEAAVDVLSQAIITGENILIYGDYDADGVTGTALLLKVLRQMGANVDFYIPHRVEEGHGISEKVKKVLKDKEVKVMITVDCGITNLERVKEIEEAGVQVVLTDHHIPPPQLPPATAVVNPHLGAPASARWLSGVGVAFMLATALRSKLRQMGWFSKFREPNLKEFLDLVAIGTIADIVPLTGDNRLFVKYGLKALRVSQRPGLKALIKAAGLNQDTVDVWDVAFRIAPRINAAGRIDHASSALRLLLSECEEDALESAAQLNRLNSQRQRVEESILLEAEESILSAVSEDLPVIVIASEGWHPGVLGIVASRVVERYSRPCIAIGITESLGIGSARAPEGWNLLELLEPCSHLLLSFGGHEYAAGLQISPELIEDFRRCVCEVAGRKEIPEKKLSVDAEAYPSELTPDVLRYFAYLEPHGEGNPRPMLLVKGLRILKKEVTPSGHLRITFNTGVGELEGVIFSGEGKFGQIRVGDIVSCVFVPVVRIKNGNFEPYLKIIQLELIV